MSNCSENLLTILITTYNRVEYLQKLLNMLLAYQKNGLCFNVVVSDDNSTDSTQEVCLAFKNQLRNYEYKRLATRTGMDGNFISAYSLCKTEYCWLLGDHRFIDYNDLKSILNKLSTKKYDALVLNCHPNNKLLENEYTEINTLLLQLGHNITNNASCVIPTRFVTEWAYKRYYSTTFLHYGIFVENLCHMDTFNVLYCANVLVKDMIELPLPIEKSGWYCHPFLNFGKLWFEFVMSLPNAISIENKFEILLLHNRKTEIFSRNNIIENRRIYKDVFVNSYKQNRRYIKYVSDMAQWQFDFLLLAPMPLLYILMRIKQIFNVIMGKSSA